MVFVLILVVVTWACLTSDRDALVAGLSLLSFLGLNSVGVLVCIVGVLAFSRCKDFINVEVSDYCAIMVAYMMGWDPMVLVVLLLCKYSWCAALAVQLSGNIETVIFLTVLYFIVEFMYNYERGWDLNSFDVEYTWGAFVFMVTVCVLV